VGITYPSPLSAGFHHLPVGLGKHSLFSGFGSVPDGNYFVASLEIEEILIIVKGETGLLVFRFENPVQGFSVNRHLSSFLCPSKPQKKGYSHLAKRAGIPLYQK
jgi:hypothetical protein